MAQRSIVAVSGQYQGPLPPPDILERYNDVYSGSAKIIIDNFIIQSNHRRSLEAIVIKAGSRDSLIGIISAFILGMTAIIGSVICILHNKESFGFSLGLTGIGGLVGTFIYGTRQKRLERENKSRMLNTH